MWAKLFLCVVAVILISIPSESVPQLGIGGTYSIGQTQGSFSAGLNQGGEQEGSCSGYNAYGCHETWSQANIAPCCTGFCCRWVGARYGSCRNKENDCHW